MNINFLSQINLGKLLKSDYIFETSPSATGLYQYLAIVFAVLILAAFVLIIKARKKEEIFKPLYAKIINLLFFTAFSGLILIFFRWQGIPYLGSRLLLVVLLAVVFVWSMIIVWYKFKILPRKIEKYQKQKIFEKYLP